MLLQGFLKSSFSFCFRISINSNVFWTDGEMQCIHGVDVPNPHNGPGRRGPRTRKRGPPSSPPSGPHRPASHPPQISGMTAKVIMSRVMFPHFMLRVTDEAGRDQCQRPDCPGENRRPVLPDGRPVPGPRARADAQCCGPRPVRLPLAHAAARRRGRRLMPPPPGPAFM